MVKRYLVHLGAIKKSKVKNVYYFKIWSRSKKGIEDLKIKIYDSLEPK